LRIYTPPVIPYTYNYLLHYSVHQGYKLPGPGFINDKCWYIIDDDQYKFRIEKWRKENIPHDATLLYQKDIAGKVSLEKWQQK
jgi:hypothetical protein